MLQKRFSVFMAFLALVGSPVLGKGLKHDPGKVTLRDAEIFGTRIAAHWEIACEDAQEERVRSFQEAVYEGLKRVESLNRRFIRAFVAQIGDRSLALSCAQHSERLSAGKESETQIYLRELQSSSPSKEGTESQELLSRFRQFRAFLQAMGASQLNEKELRSLAPQRFYLDIAQACAFYAFPSLEGMGFKPLPQDSPLELRKRACRICAWAVRRSADAQPGSRLIAEKHRVESSAVCENLEAPSPALTFDPPTFR